MCCEICQVQLAGPKAVTRAGYPMRSPQHNVTWMKKTSFHPQPSLPTFSALP